MNFEEFENFLLSNECFEYHDVSYIDQNSKQHYFSQNDYYEYIAQVGINIANGNTIKVEQYEKILNCKDSTAHVFYNQENGPTFEAHTDPVDVKIECLDGTKSMSINGDEIVLQPGDSVYIPANTIHKALNYEKALMISYGISDSETLTRIRKND